MGFYLSDASNNTPGGTAPGTITCPAGQVYDATTKTCVTPKKDEPPKEAGFNWALLLAAGAGAAAGYYSAKKKF